MKEILLTGMIVAMGIAMSREPQGTPAATAAAEQVRAAERGFAKSMADRDHAAFLSFLSNEAVFVADSQTLRGKAAVGEGWKRFYEGAGAPRSR